MLIVFVDQLVTGNKKAIDGGAKPAAD